MIKHNMRLEAKRKIIRNISLCLEAIDSWNYFPNKQNDTSNNASEIPDKKRFVVLCCLNP